MLHKMTNSKLICQATQIFVNNGQTSYFLLLYLSFCKIWTRNKKIICFENYTFQVFNFLQTTMVRLSGHLNFNDPNLIIVEDFNQKRRAPLYLDSIEDASGDLKTGDPSHQESRPWQRGEAAVQDL